LQHIATVLDHGFEYIGGDLSTDFTNTRSGRYEESGHEHVRTYADIVEFARLAGALKPSEARRLIVEAESWPEKAAQMHRRGVALREAIWRGYTRIAYGKEPAREDVEVIAAEAAEAAARARLVKNGESFSWQWPETDELSRPLWPIARAASDLLTSDGDLRHIRECSGDTCAWLFVDRTKNHTRRWCEMETCGNRAKQARLRQRTTRGARRARQPS
jgi:predicted RNA-binding Zn ribbon-like protein